MVHHLGQLFSHYRLLCVVGQGSFATVYVGEHIHLGTQAAIKVLKMDVSPDESEAFRTEARTVARLVHPHIIRVLDFGLMHQTPFLVMDYAPHGSLRQHYPLGVPLPLSHVLSSVQQVADALHYAHQHNVIHRDIKPENMLLGAREEVLLSDFGLAMVFSSSRQQGTQEMAGTIAYMAPEQIRGKPCPARDQYALGIVLYQWLTGTLPFQGSPQAVLLQHLAAPPPSMRAKVANLSTAIEAVTFQALAKEPQHRFASVEAFATAFQQAVQGKGHPTIPTAIKPSRSHHPPLVPLLRTPQHALIGREHELKTLTQLLHITQQPEEREVSGIHHLNRPYVSLCGNPGIGKTRLAEEASRLAQQQGWAVLWGRAHPQEQHMAYRVWIDILRNTLAYDYWPWQEISEHPERYQPLVALLPELAEMVFSVPSIQSESREQTQFRIWEAVQALFAAISIHVPLLIVLDDLHWADTSSGDLLGYLVRNLASFCVLLVGTCREQELSSTHPLRAIFSLFQQQNLMTRMMLLPLAENQIGQLVAHVPSPIARAIQSQAAGNPFFAEELARSPRPAEVLPAKKFSTEMSAQEGLLPSSIIHVFEQRVAQLSQASQKMLNCAAVLGNAISFSLLQFMQSSGDSPGDEETLLNQLDEVLQAGVMTEVSDGGQILYHFWHPLLAEYLYHRLSAVRRASLHRRAARGLQELKKGQEEEEAVTIVYHLIRGGSEPPLLVRYARLAGDRAYKLSAYPEAEKHYHFALQASGNVVDSDDRTFLFEQARFLEHIAEYTLVLGKFDQAREFYEEALNLHERQQSFATQEEESYEAQVCALFWCEIGRTWRYEGNSDKARECFRQGEITLTSAKVANGPAWAKIHFEQAHTYWVNGNFAEALDMAKEALKQFEAFPTQRLKIAEASLSTHTQRVLNGDPTGPGRAYILLAGIEVALGQSSQALAHLNQALAIFEKNDIKTEIANVCCNLADLHLRKAEYVPAQSLLTRSYKLAEEIGFTASVSIAGGNLGVLAARLGKLQEVESCYRQALVLAQQINELFYTSLFHSYVATALIDQGKLDEAMSFLLAALKISRSRRIAPCTNFALVVLSHLRIAQAQAHRKKRKVYNRFVKRAIHTLQHALLSGKHEAETRVEAMVALAEAFWLQRTFDAAQQQARAALEQAQQHDLVWLRMRAQHLLGTILTASGKQEDGDHYFSQAIGQLENCGMRLEYARALHNYGAMLIRGHSPEETMYQRGRSYLGHAWEIFLECDAKLDVEGVTHFLHNEPL